MFRRIPEFIVGAWIVATAILVATINMQSTFVFDPPNLALVLQIVFIAGGYSLVAYIAGVSFSKTGSPIFLLIGAAQIAAATGSTIAYFDLSNANFAATMHNSGFFLSSVLQVSSAGLALTNRAQPSRSGNPTLKVGLVYAAVLAAASVLVVATLQGVTPAFFVKGVGGTPLRQSILVSTIVLFSVASVVFFKLYRDSHSVTFYWYCLALALIADGFVAYLLTRQSGDPMTWLGRLSFYLSGVYFLALVVTSMRPTTKVGAVSSPA